MQCDPTFLRTRLGGNLNCLSSLQVGYRSWWCRWPSTPQLGKAQDNSSQRYCIVFASTSSGSLGTYVGGYSKEFANDADPMRTVQQDS